MARTTKQPDTEIMNPGDRKWDDEFNAIVNNQPDTISSALKNQESTAGNSAMNALDKDLADKGASNSISNRESAGGDAPWKNNVVGKGPGAVNKSSPKALIKRFGPSTGIIGSLVALAFGFTGGTMALLPVHIKNTFLNDLSDVTRGSKVIQDKVLAHKLKSLSIGSGGVCTGPLTIRCRFNTVDKKYVEAMERSGFKVETESKLFGNRLKLKSITLPDGVTSKGLSEGGKKITSPKEMTLALKDYKNIRLMSAFNDVVHYQSQIYNTKSIFGKTLSSLGLTKAEKLKGTTPKELTDSFDESSRAVDEEGKPLSGVDEEGKPVEDRARTSDTRTKGVNERVRGGGKIGNAVAAALGGTCQLIDTVNSIRVGIKVFRIMATAAFALTLYTAVDQMMAGKATPEQMTFIGDQLTSIDTRKKVTDPTDYSPDAKPIDNVNYGHSATDAIGYKASAFNEDKPPDSSLGQYIIAAGGFVAFISGVVSQIKKVPGGFTTLKFACGLLASKPALIASILQMAMCLGAIASLVVPGLNIGSSGFAAICAILTAGGVALSFALAKLATYYIERFGKLKLAAWTAGPDVLNATYVGTSVLTSTVAAESGMAPSNTSEFMQYMANTQTEHNTLVASDKYDAQRHPFDITNQYTAVGAIAASVPVLSIDRSSFFSTITSGFAAINSSISDALRQQVSPEAHAEFTMDALPYKPDRLKQVYVQELDNIGASADMTGNPRMTMSPAGLSQDVDDSVEYMINNHYVDDASGADATPDKEGNAYQKYLYFCSSNRLSTENPMPWGEDVRSFEEIGVIQNQEEDAWYSGLKCRDYKDERIPYFQNFHASFGANNMVDQEGDGGAGAVQDADTLSSVVKTGTGTVVGVGDDFPAKHGSRWFNYQAGQCTSFAFWRLVQARYGSALAKDGSNLETLIAADPAFASRRMFGNGNVMAGNIIAQHFAVRITDPRQVQPGDIVSTGTSKNHVFVVAKNNGDGTVVIDSYNDPAGSLSYKQLTIKLPGSGAYYFGVIARPCAKDGPCG